ncbi:hypothetical protein CHS0354_021602 [Potamilus streckersoni]|uniref:Uncharacterized protein n=1 Tax=Potamilus streckersoni TaxID=2493646 RepID=A0AAE0SPF0_9BIVA|nr:hypothetical protein CHS0354_021602 [Potamilus streckersoni]
MAAEGAGAPKRLSKKMNFVQNDEIWKDHIRHEILSERLRWPNSWGYLVREYQKLNCDLEGKPYPPSRPTFSQHGKSRPAMVKLPAIQPNTQSPRRRLSTYPKTTNREIGWKSSTGDKRLEIYGRYGPKSRGWVGILRLLHWPNGSQV